MNLWRSLLLPFPLFTASCDTTIKPVTFFGPAEIPEHLRDWRLLVVDKKSLRLNDRVVPYDLNAPLFSD